MLGLRIVATAQETGETPSTKRDSPKPDLSAQQSEPPSEAPEAKAASFDSLRKLKSILVAWEDQIISRQTVYLDDFVFE